MTRVGITGHQILPKQALAHIRRGIADVIAQAAPPVVAVSSLAAGADQEFAECAMEAGATLHAIVPCRGYEKTFSDDYTRARFERLLERASTVERLDYAKPSEEAFLAAGMRTVSIIDLLVAVWDGEAARGKGGTADIVEYARATGKAVEVVWPKGAERSGGS